jgi:hypothetical protein
VTRDQLAEAGIDAPHLLGLMAASLGLRESGEPVAAVADLLEGFSLDRVPHHPWVFSLRHRA